MVNHNERQLRKIADSQCGYFTAYQANQAGFIYTNHTYHTKMGHWKNICRGVFRLANYENSHYSDCIKWILWAKGRAHKRIISISHESALHYYGLISIEPMNVHLTSTGSSVKKKVDGNCVIHQEALSDRDVVTDKDFWITSAYKTLSDMKPDLILQRKWEETIRLAQNKDLITEAEANTLRLGQPMHDTPISMTSFVKGNVLMSTTSSSVPGNNNASYEYVPKNIAASNYWKNKKGLLGYNSAFTLVELLVVIAIIAVLASFLLPVLRKSQDMAYGVGCANNLRQSSMALQSYIEDNRGFAPAAGFGYTGGERIWYHKVMKYTYELDVFSGNRTPYTKRNSSVIYCPADTRSYLSVFDVAYSYTVNGSISPYEKSDGSWNYRFPRRISAYRYPSNDCYLYDGWSPVTSAWCIANTNVLISTSAFWVTSRETDAISGKYRVHSGGFSMLYLDMHVNHESYETMETKIRNADYFKDK